MNKINPKKLLNSKWTAVNPTNKEKHFIVSEIDFEEEKVTFCLLQAIMTKRNMPINWKDLKNENVWQQGWK